MTWPCALVEMGNGAVDGSRPWQVEGKAAVVDTADVADLTDMVGVSDVVYMWRTRWTDMADVFDTPDV